MNREIYKVFATQIVKSESNPQGVLLDVPNYPIPYDSREYKKTTANPNGDAEIALYAAREGFNHAVVTLSTADAPTRVGWVVTLIRTSDGKEIDRKPWGGYPDLTPPPPPETQTTEQNQGDGE